MNLEQSSTNVRKNLFPSYVGWALGPYISEWSKSKGKSNKLLELGKDNLLNLASGQTEQLEEEKLGENCKPILLFK